jgi:toxin ParE1/3/4
VPSFRTSARARADILNIAIFTIQRWNEAQAGRYLAGLNELCGRVAKGDAKGRARDDIAPGLHRIGYMSHAVLYRLMPYGVRIVRVLHQRQLPDLHSFDDEPDDDEDE